MFVTYFIALTVLFRSCSKTKDKNTPSKININRKRYKKIKTGTRLIFGKVFPYGYMKKYFNE